MNRVKKLHEEKHEKERINGKIREQEELCRKKELEILLNKNSPSYSNWRFDLGEAMTTQAMTYATTLPAEGDTVLTNVPATADAMGSLYGLEVDGEIKFGTVEPGGGQYGGNWYQWATTNAYDTSLLSHLSFRLTVGTGNNAPLPAHPLKVDYYAYDGDGGEFDTSFSLGSIAGSLLSSGEYNFELPPDARRKNTFFQFKVDSFDETDSESYRTDYLSRLAMGRNFWGATVADSATAARIWDIVNNDWGDDDYKSTSVTLLIFYFYNGREYGGFDPWPVSGETGGHTEADRLYLWDWIKDNFSDLNGNYARTFTVSNIGLKRKTPITVFVPLDSPEAAAFIRTDPIMANLSPQERLKKLKEMLEASDEYLEKIFGEGFPGTGLDPAVGEAGDTPGVDTIDYGTDLTPLSDNPYGTEVAQVATAADLAGLGIGTAEAIAMGAAGLAALFGMGIEAAQNLINQISQSSDPYGQDQAGPTTTGQQLPGTKDLTPQQQAEVEAVGKELSDARRALNDAEESGNQTQIDMAQERLNRATNRRQSLRKKHREENKNRKESFETKGKFLFEKRKLKSPEEVLNKIPGYYDGKPAPLGFPVEQPPKMKNGMHPDLVDGKKVADRFNRLDPQSAKSMPLTGNPHIDKKVKAARKKPK